MESGERLWRASAWTFFSTGVDPEAYTVHAGGRIAQMIVARYEAVEWEEGDLADSRRGTGGADRRDAERGGKKWV